MHDQLLYVRIAMLLNKRDDTGGCLFRFIDSHKMAAVVEYHFLSVWHQLAKIIGTFRSEELRREQGMNKDGCVMLNNLPDLDDPKESELDAEDSPVVDIDAQDEDSHARLESSVLLQWQTRWWIRSFYGQKKTTFSMLFQQAQS